MGLWLMAEDKIEVVPAVDDKFIREFIEFSIISCPTEYCREKFANPIIADYDKGFWELAEVRAAEYKKWKERSEAIMDGNHGLDSLFSFTRTQRTLPPLPRGFVSESCEQGDA